MSSFLPDFLLPLPGVDRPSVELPDVAPQERRWRRVGALALVGAVVAVGAGVVAVVTGALEAGTLGTVLAVAFGVLLVTGLLVDLVLSLRLPRPDQGMRPGLRAASFFYAGALVCVVATFGFLAT